MVGHFEKLGLGNSSFAIGLSLQFQHNCVCIRLDLTASLRLRSLFKKMNESVYVTVKDGNLTGKELSRIHFFEPTTSAPLRVRYFFLAQKTLPSTLRVLELTVPKEALIKMPISVYVTDKSPSNPLRIPGHYPSESF